MSAGGSDGSDGHRAGKRGVSMTPAEVARTFSGEGPRNRRDDRHRKLQQLLQAEAPATQPLDHQSDLERLAQRYLVEAEMVAFGHHPGDQLGEGAGILARIGKRVAGLGEPVERADRRRLRSRDLGAVDTRQSIQPLRCLIRKTRPSGLNCGILSGASRS